MSNMASKRDFTPVYFIVAIIAVCVLAWLSYTQNSKIIDLQSKESALRAERAMLEAELEYITAQRDTLLRLDAIDTEKLKNILVTKEDFSKKFHTLPQEDKDLLFLELQNE